MTGALNVAKRLRGIERAADGLWSGAGALIATLPRLGEDPVSRMALRGSGAGKWRVETGRDGDDGRRAGAVGLGVRVGSGVGR